MHAWSDDYAWTDDEILTWISIYYFLRARLAASSDVPLGVTEHDKGGHFAAYERPDAIVQDLRSMFAKSGGAFGVVAGKDGY
ncbi:hypothetical protein HBH56_127250 [Parastagonospora nodorum]|nr:hypothetical protein HBH56_127250 [Parastagonospora nodorum]KAH3947440.1 hypothetical protein HBH53_117530 [Parastagonospora nodorum]KAH3970504.1 hypothetical protein HBH51_113960 [Parastagonospora nodorum]KAH3971533.1 hypothetical protein HBH52_156230 [Parastagonospora nodorum]KAH3996324.1 hypothetical protein HBI10_155330 [Parastagonospora nodorum]